MSMFVYKSFIRFEISIKQNKVQILNIILVKSSLMLEFSHTSRNYGNTMQVWLAACSRLLCFTTPLILFCVSFPLAVSLYFTK